MNIKYLHTQAYRGFNVNWHEVDGVKWGAAKLYGHWRLINADHNIVPACTKERIDLLSALINANTIQKKYRGALTW